MSELLHAFIEADQLGTSRIEQRIGTLETSLIFEYGTLEELFAVGSRVVGAILDLLPDALRAGLLDRVDSLPDFRSEICDRLPLQSSLL